MLIKIESCMVWESKYWRKPIFISGEVKLQATEAVGVLFCITVQINRQAGVNGIGKYCGQYGLSKGKNSLFEEEIEL